MGPWAVLLVLAAGIVCGFVAQAVGSQRYRFEWLITAIGAGLGALAGGRYLETWTTWGPSFDGLYVLPAVLGAIFVGGVFEITMRASAPLGPSTTATWDEVKRGTPAVWSPD
jgi:uncharacterized membrane protein YeaQ/YmgE (transglycosylase-associated protein family)